MASKVARAALSNKVQQDLNLFFSAASFAWLRLSDKIRLVLVISKACAPSERLKTLGRLLVNH